MKNLDIVVYSGIDCNYCGWALGLAAKLTDEHGGTLIEINAKTDPKAQLLFQEKGFTSVPQVYINGEHIGGYTQMVNWAIKEDVA